MDTDDDDHAGDAEGGLHVVVGEDASAEWRRQRYSDSFKSQWSNKMELSSAVAQNQVKINNEVVYTDSLFEKIMTYMEADAVEKVKVDVKGTETRERIFAYCALAAQNGKFGHRLRTLKLNVYMSLSFDLPLLLCADRLTVLKLKEVFWTNSVYVKAHFGAIKKMTHLEEFVYKYPSNVDSDVDADLTREVVATAMEDSVKGKALSKFELHGASQFNAKMVSKMINGLLFTENGLRVKLKRCAAMDVREFGALLSAEARNAITKLEVHGLNRGSNSPAHFETFKGMQKLVAASFYQHRDASGQLVANLITVFMPNILGMSGYKNNTGFKLGVNAKNYNVISASMQSRQLVSEIGIHKDGRGTQNGKNDYTFLCELHKSHDPTGNVRMRLKLRV